MNELSHLDNAGRIQMVNEPLAKVKIALICHSERSEESLVYYILI